MVDKDRPTIEFLIPYFGPRNLLEIAVRSVLGQDHPDWRLRVVQDGPRLANIEAWLTGLNDDRISYHQNSHNLGTAGNFQRCLELATGSHVVFLGCDDELMPNYVTVVRSTLARHPDATVIQPRVRVIDLHGREISPLADRVKRVMGPRTGIEACLEGEELAASLARGNWLYFPALCWGRDQALKHGFRQDLPVTLDLEILSRIVLDHGQLVVAPEAAFRYRRHAGSLSSSSAREVDRFEEEARLLDELATDFERSDWPRAARAARRRLMSRLHVLTHLPRALVRRDHGAFGRLVRLAVLT